ncbi:MAG: ribonuclease III [SAR202 cluster bacterium]|nr:ribonuclease III [SAR202 cluster bacterium]MDP6300489.1 ribonuclease III [SAR202 cluster bacterium]MDP7102088.1 ribonuclease III [SAR202 cluster bacterium]MDP7224121.1 ribonuclease III [SAR202 cluster bacterium]MDP7412310.1 ribonuclease III [SAR202 cluster bacterium]
MTASSSSLGLDELQRSLGVTFDDPGLLELALVHSSYVAEYPDAHPESNERLEYLGDALVGLVVAHELYQRFPDNPEGRLTQMRAALVSKEALARVAESLDLGASLIVGKGEAGTGGAERESNLADAFEAVVGAVLIDQGYDVAREFTLRALADSIRAVSEQDGPPRHPKSLLHEVAMSRGFTPPSYRVISTEGEDHLPRFTCEVVVNGERMGTGAGRRKAHAEREAAAEALETLGHEI